MKKMSPLLCALLLLCTFTTTAGASGPPLVLATLQDRKRDQCSGYGAVSRNHPLWASAVHKPSRIRTETIRFKRAIASSMRRQGYQTRWSQEGKMEAHGMGVALPSLASAAGLSLGGE